MTSYMTIDKKISDVIKDLDHISKTKPNIAVFWKTYILKKEEMLNNILNDCKNIINNLTEDVDPEELAIAYIFAKSLQH